MTDKKASCPLDVKLMNSERILMHKIPLDTTVRQLYRRIREVEEEPEFKLMLVVRGSPKTLKEQERNYTIAAAATTTPPCNIKTLEEYGVVADEKFRLEVILPSSWVQKLLAHPGF